MEVGYQEAARLNNDVLRRLQYIAELNPRGVNKLATKYGYPCPRENVQSKMNFLALFFSENGSDDNAIDELVMANPDYKLFEETILRRIQRPSVRRTDGPLKYQPQEEDGFVNVDDFDGYDSFIDDNDTYSSNDTFIGAIADAVKGIADTTGKFAGTGKKGREAQQKLAEEQTKQGQTAIQIAAIQARQAQKEAKAKTKKVIIISSIGAVVLIVALVLFLYLRKRGK